MGSSKDSDAASIGHRHAHLPIDSIERVAGGGRREVCRQQSAAEGGVPRSRRGEWRANCPSPAAGTAARSPSLVGAVGPTLFLPHPNSLPTPQTSKSRFRLGDGLHPAQPAPARFHQPCSRSSVPRVSSVVCLYMQIRSIAAVTTSRVLCMQQPCDPAKHPQQWGEFVHPADGAFGQSRDHRGERSQHLARHVAWAREKLDVHLAIPLIPLDVLSEAPLGRSAGLP